MGRPTVGANVHKEKTNGQSAQEKKRVPAKFHVPHLHANGSLFARVEKKMIGRKVDEYPQ